MADILAILRLKIYEVVNGNDNYLYDDNWYVPYFEEALSITSPLLDDAIEAANMCNIPFKTTLFYMKDRIVPSFLGSKNLVDITPFKGKTIKCVIKGFEPELSFTLQFPNWDNSETVYSVIPNMKLYRGGNLVTSSQNPSGNISGGISCTNTRRWDPWATENGSSLLFGTQDGGLSIAQFHVEFTNPSAGEYANKKYQDARSTFVYDGELFQAWLNGYTPESPDDDNPYWDGGISDIGGGDGNFSEDSDTPETSIMPLIGAVGTGFATIFKPSVSQLKDLSELFWNSNVFTFLQNLVENITNMFTSLAMVPFDVDAGRQVSVTWLGIDTAINLTLAAKQYYEFDMGSIDMANDSRIFTSGSVLDYSPFSKLGIYLPFIGYQELDIDECRDAVINLRYRIDILSGACVAILKVGGRDLYQFTGNCLTQIPITNENMQSLVSDAVNVGIAAAGVGATGASVGADLAEAASSKSGIEFGDIANAHRSITRAESGLASASANAVIGSKPTFNKSGAISSSASMLAVKQPYLFLSTPRQSIPEHYQRYRGFPSNITSRLGDLSGFTVVEDIRLNGLVATSPEVAEIYDLLKKGVII